MTHEKNLLGDGSHHITYPVYEKRQVIDSNGDITEDVVELSEDEKKNPRSSCVFTDLGNGIMVPDVSMLDRFQAMDILEHAIDTMDISILTPNNDKDE